MKWILVTTNPAPHLPGTNHPHGAGWNVGDVFARIGTEQVIREADPAAEFEILNMDSADSILTPRPFDRAVFAGRPMFWRGCETHPLWANLLDGWLCKDPRKVIALGVGDCFPLPTPVDEFSRQLERARAKLWRLTLRRCGHGEFIVCPATWALLDRPEIPERSYCNLMQGGAHYPEFDLAAARTWADQLPRRARELQERGFEFLAHSVDEATLGLRLGWSDVFLASDVSTYLAIYATAKLYVGNRVHGALVLASRRARALAICLDSRVFSVVSAGMSATHVGKPNALEPFAESDAMIDARITSIRRHRAAAVSMLKEFAS